MAFFTSDARAHTHSGSGLRDKNGGGMMKEGDAKHSEGADAGPHRKCYKDLAADPALSLSIFRVLTIGIGMNYCY